MNKPEDLNARPLHLVSHDKRRAGNHQYSYVLITQYNTKPRHVGQPRSLANYGFILFQHGDRVALRNVINSLFECPGGAIRLFDETTGVTLRQYRAHH